MASCNAKCYIAINGTQVFFRQDVEIKENKLGIISYMFLIL